ncbi:hypothetical protein [Prevotella jejuni]
MQVSAEKDSLQTTKCNLLPFCRVQLIFCKNNANERKGSLLPFCQVQLIFCKNNANERKGSLLPFCRVQLIFCKDNFFFSIKSLRNGISFLSAYIQAITELIFACFLVLLVLYPISYYERNSH